MLVSPSRFRRREPGARSATSGRAIRRLGGLALASLHAELILAPKPGLVTPFDNGSHTDMDAATFMRSLFSLRGYFVAIAEAGYWQAGFAELNRLGRDAEVRMLDATGGVNTHRGAIFSLGLLAAAAAALDAGGVHRPAGEVVCSEVARRWGEALVAAPLDPASHGQGVARCYGARGARSEAIEAFPMLREFALPCLRTCLANGLATEAALAQTLLQLIAELDDTNLLHRGGSEGLGFARASARVFLAAGGCYRAGWQARLGDLGKQFVARRLSPGGSADLLACAWFLTRLEGP